MASAVEIPIYHHASLPDPCAYIRLLQVCSIDETRDVPVHCQLTSWAVGSTPPYTAISYTWGDPNLLELILVGGKKMEVRQNCGYVLRQAWRLKGSGYLWIDAICINQMANNEKSPQVAMMGSVYDKAVQTLACVGRHEDDSEFLFQMLHKKPRWWNQDHRHRYEKLFFGVRRLHLWALLLGNSTRARLFKAVTSFLERQYFWRLWIYQELYFGRDIQVCCQDDNAPISMLWNVRSILQEWTEHRLTMPRCTTTDLEQFHADYVRIAGLAMASTGTHRGKDEFGCNGIMRYFAPLQCADPRDRIYGTLALYDWKGTKPIEPDYNIDRFDLAIMALERSERPPTLWQWLGCAKSIAEMLDLVEEPSDGMIDAMRARLLSSSCNTMTINTKRPGEGIVQNLSRFWGTRLLFNNASWELEGKTPKPAAGLRDLPRGDASDASSLGISPTIQRWSKGDPVNSAQADILLPQDAQPQDWMLVPADTVFWSDVMLAFLAREGGDYELHLVGKVLIFQQSFKVRFGAWGDWSGVWWGDFWGKSLPSAKFGVHIDAEDVLMLVHSCDWEIEEFKGYMYNCEQRAHWAEKYFETRLCGRNSCSYAVQRDFSMNLGEHVSRSRWKPWNHER